VTVFAVGQGLSVGQTFVVATIPAGIALLGVLLSIWVSDRRAETARTDAREEARAERVHQHTLERNSLLRSERLMLYRRLVGGAETALNVMTFGRPVEGEPPLFYKRREALNSWHGPFAETLLIGSLEVIAASRSIDDRLKAATEAAAEGALARAVQKETSAPEAEPQTTAEQTTQATLRASLQNLAEQFAQMHARREVDHGLLADLVTACRNDLAELDEQS
jgi:hypothetical protein